MWRKELSGDGSCVLGAAVGYVCSGSCLAGCQHLLAKRLICGSPLCKFVGTPKSLA